MALIVSIVLSLIFLPWPWTLLGILGGIAIEVAEVTWGLSLARRWRPKTGAEAMIGDEAEVAAPCRPVGQVKVQGELWGARCDEGADVGETVRIESVEGLTLVVTPARRGT